MAFEDFGCLDEKGCYTDEMFLAFNDMWDDDNAGLLRVKTMWPSEMKSTLRPSVLEAEKSVHERHPASKDEESRCVVHDDTGLDFEIQWISGYGVPVRSSASAAAEASGRTDTGVMCEGGSQFVQNGDTGNLLRPLSEDSPPTEKARVMTAGAKNASSDNIIPHSSGNSTSQGDNYYAEALAYGRGDSTCFLQCLPCIGKGFELQEFRQTITDDCRSSRPEAGNIAFDTPRWRFHEKVGGDEAGDKVRESTKGNHLTPDAQDRPISEHNWLWSHGENDNQDAPAENKFPRLWGGENWRQ